MDDKRPSTTSTISASCEQVAYPEPAQARPHPSEFLEFATVPVHLNLAGVVDPAEIYASPIIKARSRPTSLNSHTSLDPIIRTTSQQPALPPLPPCARAATASERQMTLRQACWLYRRAILYSILLSLSITMEGFSITLISSFFAFPSFQRRFGTPTADAGYTIPTTYQSALTNGALAGECIGLVLNGWLVDQLGNRKTLALSLGFLSLTVFLAFFATNMAMLIAFQVLIGLPWGVFQTLATSYAAECMPVALRGYLTSGINLCWLVGQLISVGLLRGMINVPGPWSYRVPFALQWVWVVPILLGVLLVPESPWWLIRHDRPEEARRSLLRLTSGAVRSRPDKEGDGDNDDDLAAAQARATVDETISLMQHTNALEKHLSTSASTHHNSSLSYTACLTGANRRRTALCALVFTTQALCGTMTGYATYFYTRAGLSSRASFSLSVGMYAAGLLGFALSCLLMRRLGRRTLYLWGTAVCALALAGLGVLGFVSGDDGEGSEAIAWSQGALVVACTFAYDASIGPTCFALVAELPGTRLRLKTMVLARLAYNATSLATNVLMGRLLGGGGSGSGSGSGGGSGGGGGGGSGVAEGWDWRARAALLWAAAAAACWVLLWRALPEPRGLTFWELDVLFERRAKAREFAVVRRRLVEGGYFGEGEG